MDKITVALVCTSLNVLGGLSRHMLNIYANLNRDTFNVILVYSSEQPKTMKDFFLKNGVKEGDLICLPQGKNSLSFSLH